MATTHGYLSRMALKHIANNLLIFQVKRNIQIPWPEQVQRTFHRLAQRRKKLKTEQMDLLIHRTT